jgi:hypothetical protein
MRCRAGDDRFLRSGGPPQSCGDCREDIAEPIHYDCAQGSASDGAILALGASMSVEIWPMGARGLGAGSYDLRARDRLRPGDV